MAQLLVRNLDEDLVRRLKLRAAAAGSLRRGRAPPDRMLAQAPATRIELDPLPPTAARLALQLKHPVYDCFYLAAARLHDTYLITANRRFARRVANHVQHAPRVRLIAELA